MDHCWWARDASEPTRDRRSFPVPGTTTAELTYLNVTPAGGGYVRPSMATELSPREREVLNYVPSVLSAAEIGEQLYISVNTVKAHLRSIYRKLGVSRRRDAVIQAHRHGLL